MDWQGKTVLVTGAGGFLASHLVERLVTGEPGCEPWYATIPATIGGS